MKTYTFQSTQGFKAKGLDPKAIGESMERLRKTSALTPANYVQEAEAEDHPAHNAFEWNDTEAAKEHRLSQARSLIRAVCVQVAPDALPEPIFYRVIVDEEPRYEHIDVVGRNLDLWQQAWEAFSRHVASAERVLRQLELHRPTPKQAKRIAKAKRATQDALAAAQTS